MNHIQWKLVISLMLVPRFDPRELKGSLYRLGPYMINTLPNTCIQIA